MLGIKAEKPKSLSYLPGQAADLSINKPGWGSEFRPFTFTSLPGEEHIEFAIKTYPSHEGVTKEFLSLEPGDELLVGDVFGSLQYKEEGMFIAGGAGITPFIAILKDLESRELVGDNTLLFANKTRADIILENRFRTLLGSRFVNILSDETAAGYENGFITEDLIKKNIQSPASYFYLCGPPPMMKAVEKHLSTLGIDQGRIVKEEF